MIKILHFALQRTHLNSFQLKLFALSADKTRTIPMKRHMWEAALSKKWKAFANEANRLHMEAMGRGQTDVPKGPKWRAQPQFCPDDGSVLLSPFDADSKAWCIATAEKRECFVTINSETTYFKVKSHCICNTCNDPESLREENCLCTEDT